MNGFALVRRPGPQLAEGIVSHVERQPIDVSLAASQHDSYVSALRSEGWSPCFVEAADDLPDGPFVEDTVVVCDGLAVLTRPGAAGRRPEVDSVASAVRTLGLETASIVAPGTLDGGDVLQVGTRVYVGMSARTNLEGIAQLTRLLSARDRTVVPVRLRGVLHLKSGATALPDGSLIGCPAYVGLPDLIVPPEESGAHVVPLGGRTVLLAASAPRTAVLLGDRGLDVRSVDISEFEKLEGCVTCLSVLVPG